MEHRDERVVLETTRHRISGVLLLPVEGYRSRLSDYLNSAERDYLPLTDVEIAPLEDPSKVERHPFVAVALRQVVLAMPAAGDAT